MPANARLASRGLVVTALGLVAVAAVYVLALQFTPIERFQGPPQKILYVHVPAAWCALLSFSLVGVASILYLWLRDARLDRFADAAATVGIVFSLIMLTSGPLWGKPVWGTWWQWEARLTFTLILFFLFLGYKALRGSVLDPGERARFSAVIGILGLLLVPFVHLTVYLFRTVHPQPVLLKPSAPSMPWEMLRTLLLSLGAFTIVMLGFLITRYALGKPGEDWGIAGKEGEGWGRGKGESA